MNNNLELIWRLDQDEQPEYSYNYGDTWNSLLDVKDVDAIITILCQILSEDNITVNNADAIFKYIDNNELFIDVLMGIDYLSGGKAHIIPTCDKVVQHPFLKTIMGSPKIRKVLVKSRYILRKLFINATKIKLYEYNFFIKEAIVKQLDFFVNELDLTNNPKLMKFLDIETMNNIAGTLEDNQTELIKFLKIIDSSNELANIFFNQDKWLNLEIYDDLFKILITTCIEYVKIYFMTNKGVNFLEYIVSSSDQEWIDLFTNYVTLNGLLWCSSNNQVIFDNLFAVPEWIGFITKKELLKNFLLSNPIILKSSTAMEVLAQSSDAMDILIKNIMPLVVESITAMTAIAANSDAMTAVVSDELGYGPMLESIIAMTVVAQSSVATSAIANNTIVMTAAAKSAISMNALAQYEEGMDVITNNTSAMSIIAANATAYNTIARSKVAMNSMGKVAAAMNTLLAVAAFRTTLYASESGMNGVTNQLIGMQRIVSSTTYSDGFFTSPYYVGKGLDTLGNIGNEILQKLMTFAEVCKNSPSMVDISVSTVVMNVLAGSSVAMNIIVVYSSSMNAIANHAIGMDIIAPSSIAMTIIAANSLAYNTIALSRVSMNSIGKVINATDTLLAIAGFRTTLFANSEGMIGITGQLVGMQRIVVNATYSNLFFGGKFSVGRGLNTIGSINNTLLSTLSTFNEICEDVDAMAMITANSVIMNAIAGSSVAMNILNGIEIPPDHMPNFMIGLNAIAASSVAMTALKANVAGINLFFSNTLSMGRILNTLCNSNNSTLIGLKTFATVCANSEAMTIIATNSSAMTAIAVSSTAMAVIASSSIAMTEIKNNSIAFTTFLNSNYSIGLGIDTIGNINNSTLRGLQTITAVAANTTAMTAVAANSMAMTAIATNTVSMAAVAANTASINAIEGSTVAKTALLNSPLKQTMSSVPFEATWTTRYNGRAFVLSFSQSSCTSSCTFGVGNNIAGTAQPTVAGSASNGTTGTTVTINKFVNPLTNHSSHAAASTMIIIYIPCS